MLTEQTYLEPCPDLLLCICFLQLWVMTLLRLILSFFPSLSTSSCAKRMWCAKRKIFGILLSKYLHNFCQLNVWTNHDNELRRRRSEEGRRMTDIPVRHCAASLRGSSKWDHHQPQQQLPHLMPCSSAPSPPPASLLLLRFPQLLVIILFAEQTLTKVF